MSVTATAKQRAPQNRGNGKSGRFKEHSVHPREPIHLVQLYETDDFLFEVVAKFLAEGLAAGESLVVIATEAHRCGFADGLKSRGFDVERLVERRQLTLLDARETLSKFMVGSTPDWSLFQSVIEGVFAKTSNGGSPPGIRAYGEMVDLLWRDGHQKAAIHLEEMWNDLGRIHNFSLLCAYVVGNFFKQRDLLEVCATHEHILPSEYSASEEDGEARPMDATHVRALAAEIAQRKTIEKALRESLRDLRRTGDALRQSQEELEDFVENTQISLHRVGPDGTILWANRAELELLGYEEHEYIGRHIAEFHVDQPVIEDIIARLNRDETIHNVETRLRAKDGSVRHVLISSSVYRRDGEFIHTRCFTRDVTARKQAEEALQRSEEEIRMIADALPTLVSLMGADHRYRFANAAYRKWFGVDPASLIGKTPREAFGETAYATMKPYIDQVLAGHEVFCSTRVPFAGGVRDVEVRFMPIRAGDGNVAGWVDLVADVTERVRQQEKERLLARATALLAESLDSHLTLRKVADLVVPGLADWCIIHIEQEGAPLRVTAHADHAKVHWCEALQRKWPLRPDAPRGRHAVIRTGEPELVDDISDEMLVAFACDAEHLEALRSAGFSSYVCVPLRGPERTIGALTFVSSHGTRRLDEADLAVAQELADRIALSAENARLFRETQEARVAAEKAAQELQRTVRFNEMFAGILGHDLRNPLNAMTTAAQLVLRRSEDEKVIKPLQRILTSGERMTRMIDQLLDFTRARVGGGISLNRREADLRQLAKQAWDEVELAIPEWRFDLRTAGDLRGEWDPDRLAQVFSNLAGNAVQHGSPEAPLVFRLNGIDVHNVEIEIRNKGMIPEQILPILFEPFRNTQHKRDGSQGLGLGLFITQQIVRAHGGEISVTSSGEGETAFRIVLPRGEPSTAIPV